MELAELLVIPGVTLVGAEDLLTGKFDYVHLRTVASKFRDGKS